MNFHLLRKILLLLTMSFAFLKINAQKDPLDSAKAAFAKNNGNKEEYIRTSFFIADQYMDMEQYDSAQTWLSKIHERLPVKKASLFNYFLTSRQAEVYYYNNLQQLGLQESFRGLGIATALNDSMLLMDSYNFLGLFYMNLDSGQKSVSYFLKGLKYIKGYSKSEKYIALSKPLHLYGNLAEAYFKLEMYDSALHHANISLQMANETNWVRGKAVGHNSIGDILLAKNQTDNAFYHYQNGKDIASINEDIDVELLCYAGIAKIFSAKGNFISMQTALDTGFSLLNNNPNLNRYFSIQFLITAIDVYRKSNNNEKLATALQMKSAIETENLKNNNTQLQSILKAGVANEKTLLEFEVSEAKQNQRLANTRLIIVVVAFVLLMLGFLFYRNIQNQKLAAAAMRQKISQDLHDDIGASLSSLHIYGAIAEKNIYSNPDKARELTQKISSQSKQLMDDMNDIVWSMKKPEDSSISLEAQIKNFGVELLIDKDISFNYKMDEGIEKLLQSMTARRNILLIIKESMNNIAKHSQAMEASLEINILADNVELRITDNGVGFETLQKAVGNGLGNMRSRVTAMKGTFEMSSNKESGTSIICNLPKASFSE